MTRFVAFVLAIAVAAAFAGAPRSSPWVIYNRSASVPIGFYVRSNGPLELGALVSVAAATVAPDYARTRAYDDRSDRFIKRIAAVAGDHVCAMGDKVVLRGEMVLRRAAYDSNDEVLPAWSECRVLREGEIFLAGDSQDSFDGRYWGPISIDAVEQVWRPLNP